jgi:hypothetical protein
MSVTAAIKPIYPDLGIDFGIVLPVAAALLLLSSTVLFVPGDGSLARLPVAACVLALLILTGIAIGDFSSVVHVGLAVLLAASVRIIVIGRLDPYGERGGRGLFFAAIVVAVWHWRATGAPPLWQTLFYIGVPALTALVSMRLGSSRRREAAAEAAEAARLTVLQAEYRDVSAALRRQHYEAFAAEREAQQREQDQRRRAAMAAREAEAESERMKNLARWHAEQTRKDDEQDALAQAQVADRPLSTRQLLARRTDVLQHVYRRSGGLMNIGVPLQQIASELNLSLGQALISLHSLQDSNWLSVKRGEQYPGTRDGRNNDIATEAWYEQTAHLVHDGKAQVERMHEPSVYLGGDGNVVVVDSDGAHLDRIRITVNKKLTQDADHEAAARALALLRGQIEALEMEEKYKRRSQSAIDDIEEELAETEPKADIVHSALDRVVQQMSEAGEVYDEAHGWARRLNEAAGGIARILPAIAHWVG